MRDYLVVANWLGFKRVDDDIYEVINYIDEGNITLLNADEFALLKRIKRCTITTEEVESDKWIENTIIKFLENGILRPRRSLEGEDHYAYHTLKMFRRTKKKNVTRVLMWLTSTSVTLLSLAALTYILCVSFVRRLNYLSLAAQTNIFELLICTAIGLVCHEAGHAVTAWAHGGRVFECGILTRWHLILGAYVFTSASCEFGRIERILTNMAGIEVNLLLSAGWLLWGSSHPAVETFCISGFMANLVLAIHNMFASDADGSKVLGDIFESEWSNDGIKTSIVSVFSGRNGHRGNKKRSFVQFVAGFGYGVVKLIAPLSVLLVVSLFLNYDWRLEVPLDYLMNFAMLYMTVVLIGILCLYGHKLFRAFIRAKT